MKFSLDSFGTLLWSTPGGLGVREEFRARTLVQSGNAIRSPMLPANDNEISLKNCKQLLMAGYPREGRGVYIWVRSGNLREF